MIPKGVGKAFFFVCEPASGIVGSDVMAGAKKTCQRCFVHPGLRSC